MTERPFDTKAGYLMAQARAIAGTPDLIDQNIFEPLERLLASLDRDGGLSAIGAAAMEDRLLRLLANRLRMERDWRAHPEIEEEVIRAPVILAGAGRTGSTKLHKMLAASGDFLFLKFWQGHTLGLRTGDRNEDPAERIADAQAYIKWFDAHAPLARSIHPFGVQDPEEEVQIFEHGWFAPYLTAFAWMPSYLQWYATQDLKPQIEYMKRGLQYIQWQFHSGSDRRWLLKCPTYPGWEGHLRDVFPDATIVVTNRHPINAVTSAASLISAYSQAYSDEDRRHLLGPMMLDAQAAGMANHLAVRDSRDDLDLLDVGFTELTRDAGEVVENIYAKAGLKLTPSAQANMARWEQENRQHKDGVHRYTLSEYRLDEAAIEARFQPYIERMGSFF